MGDHEAVVGAGTLRTDRADAVAFDHRWTPDGVTVQAAFTGAHLLHLAVAGCVLNDLYREADRRGVEVHGVRVTASGGFDTQTWSSTGVTYAIEVDSSLTPAEVQELIAAVDAEAEIPRALRAGTTVTRS